MKQVEVLRFILSSTFVIPHFWPYRGIYLGLWRRSSNAIHVPQAAPRRLNGGVSIDPTDFATVCRSQSRDAFSLPRDLHWPVGLSLDGTHLGMTGNNNEQKTKQHKTQHTTGEQGKKEMEIPESGQTMKRNLRNGRFL